MIIFLDMTHSHAWLNKEKKRNVIFIGHSHNLVYHILIKHTLLCNKYLFANAFQSTFIFTRNCKGEKINNSNH